MSLNERIMCEWMVQVGMIGRRKEKEEGRKGKRILMSGNDHDRGNNDDE